MEGINKEELKDSIKNIINEGLRSDLHETPDMTSVFGIRKHINGLVEQAQRNPKLMSYIMRFNESLDRGGKDFMLFEQFGKGLEQFATGNKIIKGVINEMNEVIKEHGNELNAFKLIETINDDYVRETVRESYNEFVADPCDETRAMALEAIENLFSLNESLGMQMNLYITNTANNAPEYFSTGFVNESAQEELERRIEENRHEKLSNDIFKRVERYLDERFNLEESKQKYINEKYSLAGIANNNGLNLHDRISKVLKSDAAKNEGLKSILLEYTNALANGAYEERLYETLLQRTSKYNYLIPVDKMHNAIMEAVNDKKEQIELTKILEAMKDSYNSYIYVELIQEDVARYVSEPNMTNRVQLQNALMPYAADPYIAEMFKIIYSDDSYDANAITEKAISIKEQLDIIRQNATVSNIYTPVQYIRENESIFNVHGQYFVKKGNNISVLDKKYISQLDERFVELCHLVNDPHVEILEDRIILHGTEQSATIYEGYVEIGGYKEDAVSLRRLDEMYMKYENYDSNFYIMCSCLLENFNNIAKIDWAKHITLNENNDITADLFKLDENIYMATHNNALMKHTFYRNVNPIFCKNTLNEHMGINVSSLFSDMLPEQDKIILQLNETKNQYEKSIEDYENAIEDLEDAKEEATSDDMKKELQNAIDDSKKKLADVKDEYKKWQEETEKQMKDTEDIDIDDEDNPNVRIETNNEPLSDEEVEAHKDELSQPISQQTEGGTEVPDANITDDEFSDMLATDASDETVMPGDEDDEIDTDVVDASAAEDDGEDDGFVSALSDEPGDAEEFGTVDVDGINGDVPATDTDDDDDDIFDVDDEEGVGTEVSTEPAAEDVPDDEDIVIGDDYDENVPENPDMTTVNAETGETDGEAATDLFGGNTEDPLGTESTVDTELYNPHTETSEFNIVNVMFDGNEKDHTVMKSGEVLVLRPMVASDGRKYVDSQQIHFYLNDADNIPILQSDVDMSTAMYNAIVDAVTSHPQYNDVCTNGIAVAGENTVASDPNIEDIDTDNWEEDYVNNGSDEDKGIFDINDEIDSVDIDDEIPSEIDTDVVDKTPVVVKRDDELDFNIEDDSDNAANDKIDAPAVAEPVEPENAEDDFDFGEIFNDLDDDDETEEVETEIDVPVADPVNVEVDDDGTEIELPAQISDTTDSDDIDIDAEIEDLTADDLDDDNDESVIPESVQHRTVSRKQINENRKSILSIKKK